MTYKIAQYIHGERLNSPSGSEIPIINPTLGQTIGELKCADKKDIDMAISDSLNAFASWSTTPALKRAKILFNYKQLLEDNIDELAHIVSTEHGKTLADAKGSVMRGIEVVELHCAITQQLSGQFSTNVASHVDCHTFRQPLGVCAGVSPFNFPVMVPIWMMIPAIASGNTFILKPSEQAPKAPMRLAELLTDAGLPPGVVNVLNGDKEVVNTLLNHKDIKAMTAVASTPVAKHIYTTSINNGKRAHTFGGAKNHCLVMPDADFEQATNAIVGAAFGSAGERCMAISVVVAVGENTAEKFIDLLKPKISAITIGNGTSPNVDMGPLISKAHLDKVTNYIDLGQQEGASLLIDGRNYSNSEYPDGFFIGPSLFDNVDENMRIYQEEIFGPVLCIIRQDNFDEAIQLVNRHQYGNGTAIFTRDGNAAREFSEQVQVGMVGINIPIPVPVATHPFGGWKHSSFGDTNMHGSESIHFYTKLKTVTTRWPSKPSTDNTFVMPTHTD
jgi:malonate-semialdehyde dehydrogenase (acetylating) / methylmalonate-semialdehyde dehydrogenase